MKNRFNLNPAALITGILTGTWSLLWIVLSSVLTEEKLNIVNSIHPWMIALGTIVFTAIIHFVLSKLLPGKQFRKIPMRKLITQSQILLLILALDVLWAGEMGIEFHWILEIALIAILELVIVMDNNTKGFTDNRISPLTLITFGSVGFLAVIIKYFIDPIGKVLLFVSLKIKSFIEAIFDAFGKALLFIASHFNVHAESDYNELEPVEYDIDEILEKYPPRELGETTKNIIFAIIGLAFLACVIFLLYELIQKIIKLWTSKGVDANEFESDNKGIGFLKSIIITLKLIFNRINAVLIIKRHRQSVGFALFSLEKKYRTNRNLRRRKGETPAEFIDKIILHIQSTPMQNGETSPDIGSLVTLKQYSMRAAYDKDFSWLTELPH